MSHNLNITAATLANNGTIERALNDVVTQDELDTAIAQIASLSYPAETAVADFGTDAIAVLGDGTVLCWGEETQILSRTYRAIVVYLSAEETVGILSAQVQFEIWEDSQVSED